MTARIKLFCAVIDRTYSKTNLLSVEKPLRLCVESFPVPALLDNLQVTGNRTFESVVEGLHDDGVAN